MNLKFWTWEIWTWRRQLQAARFDVKTSEEAWFTWIARHDQLRDELLKLRDARLEEAARRTTLERELQELTLRYGEASKRLATVYQRTPAIVTEAQKKRANLERLLALADVGADHPVWRTVLSYLDEHARNEFDSALKPDLSDDVRQYNAGRAASADDLASALRDLQLEAEREAKKLKGD